MTPSGIDPATFRFVALCLNHCTAVCPQEQDYNYLMWDFELKYDRVFEKQNVY
jgi:hypothetical protein